MHILEASAALKLIRTRTVTELILKNKKQHASSTFPDAVALEPLRNFSLRREPSKILEIVFQVALWSFQLYLLKSMILIVTRDSLSTLYWGVIAMVAVWKGCNWFASLLFSPEVECNALLELISSERDLHLRPAGQSLRQEPVAPP